MAGIASNHVTFEDLLLVQSEAVLGPKDQNLVVHGLTSQPFTWGWKQAKTMTQPAHLKRCCTQYNTVPQAQKITEKTLYSSIMVLDVLYNKFMAYIK